MKKMDEQIKKLIEKAKKEWNEDWKEGQITYDEDLNEIVVFVGRYDVYKAYFNPETLECTGTKC